MLGLVHMIVLAASLVLLALSASEPSASSLSGASRPNVLLIVADDLSDRDMDNMATPRIDDLAGRGIRFRRAYANPVCSQSRRSLQFGEYRTRESGDVCGNYSAQSPRLGQWNLGRLFSGQGYRTGFFGKWHIGSYPGVLTGLPWEEVVRLHGYETWRAGSPINLSYCLTAPTSYTRWTRVDDGISGVETTYHTDAVRDAFLQWKDEVESERWFAVINFQAPHAPFHFPPGMKPPVGPMPPTDRDMYEAMVAYLDTVVGELVDSVDLDDTLVIFLGDNGTPTAVPGPNQEGNRVKTTTFEEGIRVPLIWAGPGLPRAVESQALFHMVDFLTTFSAFFGVAPNDSTDGVSQLPVLADPTAAVRRHLFCGAEGSYGVDHAIVTQRWKYRERDGVSSLFDLKADPYEDTNLIGAPRSGEIVLALQRILAGVRAEL